MFSSQNNHQDVDMASHQLYLTDLKEGDIDAIMERYVALINRMKSEIQYLKTQLAYHKKLHGELSDSLDEFLTIQKASEIITRHLDYSKIARALLDLCRRVFPFQQGNVLLHLSGKWEAVLKDAGVPFEKLLDVLVEEGIVDWIWENHQTIVIPGQDFFLEKDVKFPVENLVISPLAVNENRMGLLILNTNRNQSEFSQRDLDLINLLGVQAAIAIQYTRLYKDLEKTHQELKNSQAHLIQAIKLATVGELAGGIAHEINNPLQIILGKIQVARMGHTSPDVFKVVEMQALRIATIIRGLLMLAKENTSQASDFIEINPLIMNTLKLVQGQIEKRGITIQTKLAKNLPVVTANSVYFQQILLNFFLTAKKQMSKGGTLFIETRLVDDKWIEIRLEDTGEPLDSQTIANALQPFSQMGLPGNMQTNLGIMVSVQMIRDIGGDVEIKPRQPQGNIIQIRIPKELKLTSGSDDEPFSQTTP